jgi:hypothetical protein
MTPPWAVHRLLERTNLPGGRWLEPGAGTGNIIRAVREVRQDVVWTVVERDGNLGPELQKALDPKDTLHIGQDFVDLNAPAPYILPVAHAPFDVVIGNPPYRLALEFVERALQIGNIVAMLLRLNFCGTEERHSFFKKFCPDIFVLPNRPSFRGEGSDSIEYAWYVWRSGSRVRPYGRFTVLDLTPLAVRKEQKPEPMGPVQKQDQKAEPKTPVKEQP